MAVILKEALSAGEEMGQGFAASGGSTWFIGIGAVERLRDGAAEGGYRRL